MSGFMASQMTPEQRRTFLLQGTRTAILSTVRADGRAHAAPIWFLLDGDDVVFNTGADTVKGRNLARDPRAVLTVDDSDPPFSFVIMDGTVDLSEDLDEVRQWATSIGGRYLGADRAEELGRRNGVPGELLVRFTPTKISAYAGISD
jgi:PPOX class probable F420-dependent enzyme